MNLLPGAVLGRPEEPLPLAGRTEHLAPCGITHQLPFLSTFSTVSYPRLLAMLALTRFRSASGETEFELIKPSMRRLASSFLLPSVTSVSFSLQYDEWMKPNPALRRRPGERRRSTISFLQSHGCAVVHARRRRSQDGSVPTARAKARFNRTASARAVISSPIGISLHRRARKAYERPRTEPHHPQLPHLLFPTQLGHPISPPSLSSLPSHCARFSPTRLVAFDAAQVPPPTWDCPREKERATRSGVLCV